MVNKAAVLRLRNKLLPLVCLSSLLKLDKQAPSAPRKTDDAFVIVAQLGLRTFGIVVDEVFDTEEIVVKPMVSPLRHLGVFSGTTILGDGRVIMILDPNGIAESIAARESESDDEDEGHAGDEARRLGRAAQRSALLVFRAGAGEPKAVPLALVTRLEEIEADRIERAGGQPVVQYRGKLMPLIAADPAVVIKDSGRQPVVVFSNARRNMGLVVDRIEDIVEDVLTIELATARPGVIGSAVLRGRITCVLDVAHFLKLADESWFEEDEHDAVARKHVLVVEANPFFRHLVAPLLLAAGYQVTSVDSVEAALRLKEQGVAFDLIVSEIDLPGIDGLSFARMLKDDPDWRAVRRLALSRRRTPEDVEETLKAGFHSYVPKLDRDALIAAVSEQLALPSEAA
jgi:two-component system chemotaxis sensor kinase CheA